MMAAVFLKSLLEPQGAGTRRPNGAGIVALLALSAISVFVAPLVMPEGYSWLSNAISESAAQGLAGAWVARLGFLLFGFAVLWLAISRRSSWARGALWCHMAFGMSMVSTAVFSHRPWQPGVPFDTFEDLLHSVTATGMGFAFSFGVILRLLQRDRRESLHKALDAVAVVAATALPLLGGVWPSHGGLTQRMMFLIAYLWYGAEASRAPRPAR